MSRVRSIAAATQHGVAGTPPPPISRRTRALFRYSSAAECAAPAQEAAARATATARKFEKNACRQLIRQPGEAITRTPGAGREWRRGKVAGVSFVQRSHAGMIRPPWKQRRRAHIRPCTRAYACTPVNAPERKRQRRHIVQHMSKPADHSAEGTLGAEPRERRAQCGRDMKPSR